MNSYPHRKGRTLTLALLAGTTILTARGAFADQATDDKAALAARLDQLQQELELVKRKLEVQDEKTKASAEKSAVVDFGKRGLNITSPDKKYGLSLRGTFQVDHREFFGDDANNQRDESLARRLRPTLEFKAGDTQFRFMPDFAGANPRIFDANIDYKVNDALQFRVGKFKTPISMERLQSASELTFIERSHPSNLGPIRDFGLMAFGFPIPGVMEYQLGVFNGNADLANTDGDDDDNKDIVGRVFAHPFRNSSFVPLQGFGAGVAGSYGKRDGTVAKPQLGAYRSPGQQDVFKYSANTFADGIHWRVYPQAYWYEGPFGVLGEYAISHQEVTSGANTAELEHKAWELTAAYMLTGEDLHFDLPVKPHEDFNFRTGGPGAWKVAVRAGSTDVDNDAFPLFADPAAAVSEAFSYGAGVDWFLDETLKLQLNYEVTQFKGGAAGGGDRPDEQVLISRAQVRF